MKKELLLIIILGVIIVVLAGALLVLPSPSKAPVQNNTEGLQIISPKSGQDVASPLKIIGTANGGGWSGFEGQVGTIKMVDYKGNVLATGILTAVTDWTKSPLSFETTLNFMPYNSLPIALEFKNENPSGDPAKDKTFTLSVNPKH
jgi:hypothetical protein